MVYPHHCSQQLAPITHSGVAESVEGPYSTVAAAQCRGRWAGKLADWSVAWGRPISVQMALNRVKASTGCCFDNQSSFVKKRARAHTHTHTHTHTRTSMCFSSSVALFSSSFSLFERERVCVICNDSLRPLCVCVCLDIYIYYSVENTQRNTTCSSLTTLLHLCAYVRELAFTTSNPTQPSRVSYIAKTFAYPHSKSKTPFCCANHVPLCGIRNTVCCAKLWSCLMYGPPWDPPAKPEHGTWTWFAQWQSSVRLVSMVLWSRFLGMGGGGGGSAGPEQLVCHFQGASR